MTNRNFVIDADDPRSGGRAVRPGPGPADASASRTVAILGLGYVGLPTALAMRAGGARTIGIDVSPSRLRAIRAQRVDLVEADRQRLAHELDDESFILSANASDLSEADAVLICVPTPVDEHRSPDLGALRAACADVVRDAVPGQTIILTSTSYAGTTRDLLVEPLRERGLVAGRDLHVAFSPERIDPGNPIPHEAVPRVVGGATPSCTEHAVGVLSLVSDIVVPVSSLEAAEMSKLLENSFRAINIAFANEFADACAALGLEPREIIDAAATKPYGFMPFYPGTGVGGHCIPCDPHYLLWQLRASNGTAPILSHAMEAIAARPLAIVDRAAREMAADGRGMAESRILVVGVAYKPGVDDVRESPGIRIVQELLALDARVDFFDPRVPSLRIDDHQILLSVPRPDPLAYDAVIVNTLHADVDYGWIADARVVIDPSGRLGSRHGRDPESIEPPDTARTRRRVAESRVPLRIDS